MTTLRGSPRFTLLLSVVGAMIVALDGTVLLLVQPTMQRDLGASLPQIQWTSTGCLIAVASLLIFAGRLAALAGLLAASASLFGTLFVATYYLHEVLALDPLASGLRVLPLTAMMVIGAPVVGLLLRRFTARGVAVTAMGLVALGIGLLSRLDEASTTVAIGGCSLVLGAGFSAMMVTATGVVVGHAPAEAAGVAGGLQQTVMNVGPTLGFAAATTLLGLATPDATAFVSAMGTTLLALAAVAAVGVLFALMMPRGTTPEPATVPAPSRRRLLT